ncbi:hypothetical protein A2982_00675 [candidate division WWE3 bacterium RIFCSPLOWO2_01_FULL_39_13]|uniref:Nudix hydrolase domain-containing protein n=1 Tax=candidate division WWE3 bacterium RIFCSPLOWO2_01_FULL_39_13 TaxID=1802624 RepID=A0A1F4V412_UNCKA|nr:MAG: hypothetical protein A2982_00675 [candidate division WWE3 bacterium RIFCSPLOWO2_01_FULL_39_13]
MKVTGVHVLLINSDNKFLLTQRKDVPLWVIPGGTVEKNEDPKKACERELFEETRVKAGRLILAAKYKVNNGVYKNLYIMRVPEFNIDVFIDKKEVKSYGWFTIENLPSPMSLYEISRVYDAVNFKGKMIERALSVNIKKEFLNQLKNPFIFLLLLASFVINRLTNKSFKL